MRRKDQNHRVEKVQAVLDLLRKQAPLSVKQVGSKPVMHTLKVKDVVAPLVSNVWLPVSKKQHSSSKDKEVIDQALDIAVKNRFDLLGQQPSSRKVDNLVPSVAMGQQNSSNAPLVLVDDCSRQIKGVQADLAALPVVLESQLHANIAREPMDLQVGNSYAEKESTQLNTVQAPEKINRGFMVRLSQSHCAGSPKMSADVAASLVSQTKVVSVATDEGTEAERKT